MNKRTAAAVALTTLALIKPAMAQSGVALVDDPFVHSYQGWVDAFPTTRAGNWRLSLHNPTLMDTNNANPPTSGATNDAGTYEPDVLIKDDFLAPASYEYTASMRSNDDDIIGLVWNYQDPSNYFRAGIRTQNAGSFGGTRGLAVQKIVGGVVTQLNPAGTGPGTSFPITQAMINNRTAFDLKVVVNGSNYDVQFNGASLAVGARTVHAPNLPVALRRVLPKVPTQAIRIATLGAIVHRSEPLVFERALICTNVDGLS